MTFAIDTNSYVAYQQGRPDVVELISTAARVFLPFIVLAELRAGFRNGSKAVENERTLTQFLTSRVVDSLWPDEGTTHLFADLFAELRRAGTPIPGNDIWIAALCVQHGLPLLTRDRHFERIPRLARI